MKKMIILAMLACVAFAGCSKSDDNGNSDGPNGNSDGPKKFPKDVATAIKDIVFRQYCIEHFDANKDGQISEDEALGVNVIELKDLDIYSLAGMEYFPNLRKLYCERLKIEDVDISIYKKLGSNFKFDRCSDLKTAKLSEELTVIPEEAFWGCGLTTITIPDSVTAIGKEAFNDCKGLTIVTIGNSVTTIGDSAFYDCTRLASINIPDNVTAIGGGAFWCCEGLTSIKIPDRVTTIGSYTFNGCEGLTNITIPDGVTKIGERAFSYCKKLTSITIPDRVTEIGGGVLSGCKGLKTVYCKATTPPSLSGLGDDISSDVTIYVPRSSVGIYKSAKDWKIYADDIKGYDF